MLPTFSQNIENIINDYKNSYLTKTINIQLAKQLEQHLFHSSKETYAADVSEFLIEVTSQDSTLAKSNFIAKIAETLKKHYQIKDVDIKTHAPKVYRLHETPYGCKNIMELDLATGLIKAIQAKCDKELQELTAEQIDKMKKLAKEDDQVLSLPSLSAR